MAEEEKNPPPLVRKGRRAWKLGVGASAGRTAAASLGLMVVPLSIVAPLSTPIAPPMTPTAPFTGLYPLSVSALASSVDTRQLQDAQELFLEIHKWAAPFAQRVAAKYGMYIPYRVDYSFEKLPPVRNSDGSMSPVYASVERYDANRYEIKVDLANCVAGARSEGRSLHDFVAEIITHELGHIAKKTDPEIVRSVTQLRDIDEVLQIALTYSKALRAMGRIDDLPHLITLGKALRVAQVAEIVSTLREGFGEHVMAEVMTRAAREGRLDDPSWSYRGSARPPKYPNGKNFIEAMAADPRLGTAGVTRLLRLRYDQSHLLPVGHELKTDFAGWADRASMPLMSETPVTEAPSALSQVDVALLHEATRLLTQTAIRRPKSSRTGGSPGTAGLAAAFTANKLSGARAPRITNSPGSTARREARRSPYGRGGKPGQAS